MDEPWSSFCTMSIVHFMAFPEAASGEGRIAESIRSIAEDDFFDAIRVAKRVRARHPHFWLLYDLSHMPLLEEAPADIAIMGDYLTHVHIGNCVKAEGQSLYGDMHPYIGFPGGVNGVDELAHFIKGLFSSGYLAAGKHPKPWVGFEVKPQGPTQTPGLIIASAKRTWRQAWARV